MMHSGLYGKSRRHQFAEGKSDITPSNTGSQGQKTGTSPAHTERPAEAY
jgi:hypothetical protein